MFVALNAYRLIPISSYFTQIKFNTSSGLVNILKLNRLWKWVELHYSVTGQSLKVFSDLSLQYDLQTINELPYLYEVYIRLRN